jgi:hypothetical protein
MTAVPSRWPEVDDLDRDALFAQRHRERREDERRGHVAREERFLELREAVEAHGIELALPLQCLLMKSVTGHVRWHVTGMKPTLKRSWPDAIATEPWNHRRFRVPCAAVTHRVHAAMLIPTVLPSFTGRHASWGRTWKHARGTREAQRLSAADVPAVCAASASSAVV